MNEALGETGRLKLPRAGDGTPHLDCFEPRRVRQRDATDAGRRLEPVVRRQPSRSIVMPQSTAEAENDLADRIRIGLGEKLAKYVGSA